MSRELTRKEWEIVDALYEHFVDHPTSSNYFTLGDIAEHVDGNRQSLWRHIRSLHNKEVITLYRDRSSENLWKCDSDVIERLRR